MKKITAYAAIALVATMFIIGCSTTKDLAPNGAYNQDAYLYNIDQTVVVSYNVIDQFLIFEMKNNDWIKTNSPEVFKIANDIRDKTPNVLKNISTARNLYIKYLGNTNELAANKELAKAQLSSAVGDLSNTALIAQSAIGAVSIGAQAPVATNVVNILPQ